MTTQPLILIVEDEASINEALSLNLRLEGYRCISAFTGKEALGEFAKEKDLISLILLDVMLPDHDGFELCEKFKGQRPDLPVVFLSARALLQDKKAGLKLGADDYITKPFDLEEVLLRISNLLKRTHRKEENILRFDGREINFETFEVIDVRGARQTLSRREIGLLRLLASQRNKVVSRDEILEELWDASENASSRTIDNYILNFRKYFESNPREPQYFHSVRGVGYKFSLR